MTHQKAAPIRRKNLHLPSGLLIIHQGAAPSAISLSPNYSNHLFALLLLQTWDDGATKHR